jgi:hypothetical protein
MPQGVEIYRLQYYFSETQFQTIAILSLNRAADHLDLRFTEDYGGTDDRAVLILGEFAADMTLKAAELGGIAFLDHLLHSVANTFRLSDPLYASDRDADTVLDVLAAQLLCERTNVNRPRVVAVHRHSSNAPLLATHRERTSVRRSRITLGQKACGIAAALVLLVAVVTGLTGVRNNGSHTITNSHTTRVQVPTPVVTETSASKVLPVQTARSNTVESTRTLTAVYSRIPKPKLRRAFIPPAQRPPERSPALIDSSITLAATGAFGPVLPACCEADLPLPPAKSTRGLRRILRAVSEPFRTVGRELAESTRPRKPGSQ